MVDIFTIHISNLLGLPADSQFGELRVTEHGSVLCGGDAELGEVDAIHTTHANPLTLMRLRAAYGAPVENCSPADSPADSPGDDAVALARGSESCEQSMPRT